MTGGGGTPEGSTRLRRRRLVRRAIGGGLSVCAHGAGVLALLLARTPPPPQVEARAVVVTLVEDPPPPTALAPQAALRPALSAPRPQPRRTSPSVRPPPKDVPTLAAARAPDKAGLGVSDAELAGAATAGSGEGEGGRPCDMLRLLQAALRRDPMIQKAVATGAPGVASGRAVRVWNGDWIASAGQDGKGLAAVREAIMYEVAFAPKACRDAEVRGLVLLAPTAGGPRLVLGVGAWRWSDLLASGEATTRGGPEDRPRG